MAELPGVAPGERSGSRSGYRAGCYVTIDGAIYNAGSRWIKDPLIACDLIGRLPERQPAAIPRQGLTEVGDGEDFGN
jgi:hypothetical protein